MGMSVEVCWVKWVYDMCVLWINMMVWLFYDKVVNVEFFFVVFDEVVGCMIEEDQVEMSGQDLVLV